MPSWNEGSSSSSCLPECTVLDFAPCTVDDPTFDGIAVGCPELCRVHKKEPHKCVAFEGTDIGRKFYLCPVVNEVENCGFQSWVDEEWPETLQNALLRLWEMYNTCKSTRIDERYESTMMLKEMAEEKEKLEKKHSSLLADIKKFMDNTEAKVLDQNWKAMNKEKEKEKDQDDFLEVVKERNMLKKEVEFLKNELEELKNVRNTQAEIMKSRERSWEDEKGILKEEKKKLEYSLHDLFKANLATKDKLNMIKAICDEP